MNSRGSLLTLMVVALGIAGGPAVLSAEKEGKLKSQTVTIKCAPGKSSYPDKATEATIELLQLPPGKITLTDAQGKSHEHEVKAVWMVRTEVTWNQYDIFWQRLDVANPWQQDPKLREADAKSRPTMPYEPPDAGWGHDGYPAQNIHFRSAMQYVAWLSQKTGKKFRLPTEAEWEYACRAGGPAVKPVEKALEAMAWYEKNSDDQTHPVAKKAPNAWGFYDMLGNVAEFVIVDPKDDRGVVAGGSWNDGAKDVHSGRREPYSPDWQKQDPEEPKGHSWLGYARHVGLRVVMEE